MCHLGRDTVVVSDIRHQTYDLLPHIPQATLGRRRRSPWREVRVIDAKDSIGTVISHAVKRGGVIEATAVARRPVDADRWSPARLDCLSSVIHGDLIQHGVTFLFSREGAQHGISST